MTLLERYEREAALLTPWDALGDMLADARVPRSAREGLKRSRELREAGLWQPRSGFGPFRQMVDGAVVANANQTAITGTTEAALFPAAQYTGFAANQLRVGQVWCLRCFGILTTAGASPGNITITPRFGTTSGGTALGASAATALATSGSNTPWTLEYFLIIRSVGLTGNNSNVVGGGVFTAAVAAIAASTGNVVPFGSTAAVSVDLSIAAGLYIGVTMGSASDSMTCLSHPILESLN